MKFCQHCGKEILDQAVVCPGCGCAVRGAATAQKAEVDDSVNVGFVILTVLIPLFGIIYWAVMAKTRPKCAKACGIAAIITMVLSFLVTALSLIELIELLSWL